MIDPVFLCDRKHYEKLFENARAKTSGRYLFTYFLAPDKNKYGIDLFAEKIQCGYIGTISAGKKTLEKTGFSEQRWPYPYLSHLRNEDWINYLAHASFVVTDSFHATCFSIIFKLPFVFIKGHLTEKIGFNRLSSLLQTLNLMDRVADTVEQALNNDKYLEPIDYNAVYEILDKEIENSRNWLRDAIEA